MGYTRIETIVANERKSWVEIATEGLYEMVFPSGNRLVMPDRISDICICDRLVVLRTEDRDFRFGNTHAPIIKSIS